MVVGFPKALEGEIIVARPGVNQRAMEGAHERLARGALQFSERAIEYGLPTPKGLLIIGIPGTGKSLSTKATAKVFGVPLLKLDAGRIFAGLVGQSESNLRAVIRTAEAIAPCCLWIGEVEKGSPAVNPPVKLTAALQAGSLAASALGCRRRKATTRAGGQPPAHIFAAR